MEPNLRAKSVLITGANGFIGSHLARQLVGLGATVHGFAHRRSSGVRSQDEGIQWHTGDLLHQRSIAAAVRDSKPAVVFHLAAYGATAEQTDRTATYQVNVQGTWNLAQALTGHDCRLVYAGTSAEYGVLESSAVETMACEPTWFYPATKHAAGTLLKAWARETQHHVVVLRLFGPYGEADHVTRVIPHVITSLLEGRPVALTGGEQFRSFAHIDDHVRGFVLAGVRPMPASVATFNIGSDETVQLRDLFGIIADAVGRGARDLLRVGALPYRASEVWNASCDISKARSQLGYAPQTPLIGGIARTVAWYRQERGLTR